MYFVRDSHFWGIIIICFTFLLIFITALLNLFAESLLGASSVLFGIIIGLAGDQTLKARRNESRSRDIEVLLKEDELQRMLTFVSKLKGNYLETQAWQSLIQSGEIALMKISLQRILFDLYTAVNIHNIETKELRELALLANRLSAIQKAEHRAIQEQRIEMQSKVIVKEKELEEKISQVLNSEEWSI